MLDSKIEVAKSEKAKDERMLSRQLTAIRKRWDQYTIHASRFSDLAYSCLEPGLWRVIDVRGYIEELGALSCIGSFYKSKVELLSDLDRFHREVYAPSEYIISTLPKN